MTHTAEIQRLIDAIAVADPLRDPINALCKHELNALLLHANSVYAWALRPDGEVLCIDHEAFARPSEPETDAVTRYAVLVAGARRHPALGALVPARPPDARACAACETRGWLPDGQGCLTCSGLGWWAAPRGR